MFSLNHSPAFLPFNWTIDSRSTEGTAGGWEPPAANISCCLPQVLVVISTCSTTDELHTFANLLFELQLLYVIMKNNGTHEKIRAACYVAAAIQAMKSILFGK